MTFVLAHAGHWLVGIGFAGPPLLIVAGLVVMVLRERGREAQSRGARSGKRGKPSSGIGSHSAA